MKVFRTRDFGYHRITVERPLKQRFEITDDTLAALENARSLAKWDSRDALVEALRPLTGRGVVDEERGRRRPARRRRAAAGAVADHGSRS